MRLVVLLFLRRQLPLLLQPEVLLSPVLLLTIPKPRLGRLDVAASHMCSGDETISKGKDVGEGREGA